MFFDYVHSVRLLKAALDWISVIHKPRNLPQWCMWTKRGYKGTKTRKQVLLTTIVVVV